MTSSYQKVLNHQRGEITAACADKGSFQSQLCASQSNGRTSPGGTVYKGRGVRRYQGRYMHLPLQRFQQHGVTSCLVDMGPQRDESVTNHLSENNMNNEKTSYLGSNSVDRREDCWDHLGTARRSRERESKMRSWSRSRSRSISPTQHKDHNRTGALSSENRERFRGKHHGCWSRGRTGNERGEHRNGNELRGGRTYRGRQRNFHSNYVMTPRDARHNREFKWETR